MFNTVRTGVSNVTEVIRGETGITSGMRMDWTESRVSIGITFMWTISTSHQSEVQVGDIRGMLVKFTPVKNMINLLIIMLDKSE